MAKFRRPNQFPPGGAYFYTVEQTGRFFQSRTSLRHICLEVMEHLAVNKLPVPSPRDMALEIQDHMCKRIPKGFCDDKDAGVPGIDFFSIIKATELLVNQKTKPDFYVDANEANRRAAVCQHCSLNLRHVCTNCNGMKQTFAGLIGGRRKTQYDDTLGVCAACGCGLAAKVHVNAKYLDSNKEEQAKLPAFCWLKKKEDVPSDPVPSA